MDSLAAISGLLTALKIARGIDPLNQGDQQYDDHTRAVADAINGGYLMIDTDATLKLAKAKLYDKPVSVVVLIEQQKNPDGTIAVGIAPLAVIINQEFFDGIVDTGNFDMMTLEDAEILGKLDGGIPENLSEAVSKLMEAKNDKAD